MKKYIVSALLLAILVLVPSLAGAQSIEDLQKIIADLQRQLSYLQSQQKVSTTRWCANFETNLGIGTKDMAGVNNLRMALEKEGFRSDPSVSYYDESMAAAVSGFQLKYRDEILTPQGLTNPTGYLGNSSRKKMNQLYGCGGGQLYPDIYPPTTPVPPTLTPDGPLTVYFPSGGEVFEKGQVVGIKWKNSTNEKGFVRISIADFAGNWYQLFSRTDDDGSEYWTIPNDIKSGIYYLSLSLCTADDDCHWNNWSGPFKIYGSDDRSVPPSPLSIISSYPPNGAIDARNVSDWRLVRLNFSGPVPTNPSVIDNLAIDSTIGGGQTLPPSSVSYDGPNSLIVTLPSSFIISGHRVRIISTYGVDICLGFLPGDIDQNGIMNSTDLLTMIDVINGVKTVPLYAGDLDGSGQINATDHLTMIDLINAGTGARLPACP